MLAHASDHMPGAVPLYAGLIQANPASLAAAGSDAALTASSAQPLLDGALAAVVTGTRWDPDVLAELDRHLSEGTLPRTRAAIPLSPLTSREKPAHAKTSPACSCPTAPA